MRITADRLLRSGQVVARVFLLSPANCGGPRGRQVLSPNATFALAEQLRSKDGAPLGDVFSFVSGLYFRGKLTYARQFAAPPEPGNAVVGSGVHVITPCAGLRGPDTHISHAAMSAFAACEVHAGNADYRTPLERSARALRREIGAECDVVLLGSVASPKYIDVLLGIFGGQLTFPLSFVGRGDMSRGGLLLRHARSGDELEYVPVAGAVLHGERPPKLPPLARPVPAPAAVAARVAGYRTEDLQNELQEALNDRVNDREDKGAPTSHVDDQRQTRFKKPPR